MEENAFELWKKQKEEQRQKKFQEQQEIREMMEKYWPWEHERTKPRGKSNLFEEEIYPVEEFGKVKRITEIPEVNRPKQLGNKHISHAKRAQGSKDTSATSTKSQNVEIFKKDLRKEKINCY
ncbi:uncharacterized protein LOC108732783 [Agrilus planipennis]|uniref:Uncharacterized protein LOC108732783 n=1 Tax=Agrilus planipennis TaxID=224129 RepID=A0A1W4WGL6_AGRPL|nr:uncharacterized protein LOC108732783 [Agrilus planipennis]